MSMSVEIPTELQPAIEAALARGGYANEQELVSDICGPRCPSLRITSSCDVTFKRPWKKCGKARCATQTSMWCAKDSAESMTSRETENNAASVLVGQGRREHPRHRTLHH